MNTLLLRICCPLLAFVFLPVSFLNAGGKAQLSHPPMRPLPTPSTRPMADGPAFFVDAKNGKDSQDGSKDQPWQSLQHAVKQLKPGDTLYMRGGIYREHAVVTCQGTTEKPITIRSFPGELAIVDGGLSEFYDSPETAWEPVPDGAKGEYRSVKTYPDLGGRIDSTNVLGHFADSMVPLHGYRFPVDLRADTMYWTLKNNQTREQGIYCGPGVFYNLESKRIHVRLAHTTLKALGEENYRGETDPRKVKLIIAGFKGGSPLSLQGAKHVKVQDVVVRGARTAAVEVLDCENIEFSGCTVYAGSTAFLVRDTAGLRLINTACRGIAAPWTFRGSLKYRAIEARIFSASGWQPTGRDNRDFELAYCEFTDSVDGVFLGNVRNTKFHHNLLDNVSDDGLFVTSTTGYDGTTHGGNLHIYQNRLSRCLTTIAYGVGHGRQKVLARGKQTGAGVYVYRNVFDFRRPVMYHQPNGPDDDKLTSIGRVASDHGGPAWEPMFYFHNTILADDTRGYYYGTLGLADHLQYDSIKRRVQNNIVVQRSGLPKLYLPKKLVDLYASGNLFWSHAQGPTFKGDFFTEFRKSPIYQNSKKVHAPGWTFDDQFADPMFVRYEADWQKTVDLRLSKNSPAIDRGVSLSDNYEDPLRKMDKGKPDIGAIPFGVVPWRIGQFGRLTVDGNEAKGPFSTPKLASLAAKAPPLRNVKPVAIVEGYPAFDKPLIAFTLRRHGIPVEEFVKQWLPIEEYRNYSMIVLVGDHRRAKTDPYAFSKEAIPHLQTYLENGGKVLLMRSATGAFATPDGRTFLNKLRGLIAIKEPGNIEILKKDHSWVRHLQADQPHPWLNRKNNQPWLAPNGENIIGSKPGLSILFRTNVGKGQFIYVGWEISNSLPSGRNPKVTVEEERTYEEQIRILQQMVRGLYGNRKQGMAEMP